MGSSTNSVVSILASYLPPRGPGPYIYEEDEALHPLSRKRSRSKAPRRGSKQTCSVVKQKIKGQAASEQEVERQEVDTYNRESSVNGTGVVAMCNSKVKSYPVAQIDGRPVLQPACNRVVPTARPVLKKSTSMPAARHAGAVVAQPWLAPAGSNAESGSVSLKLQASLVKPAAKRGARPSGIPPISPAAESKSSSSSGTSSLNSSTDGGSSSSSSSSKPPSPRSPGSATRVAAVKKPKKSTTTAATYQQQLSSPPSPPLAQYITLSGTTLVFDDRVPGSLAAAQREQSLLVQAQRKMRIAHYGRSKSARFDNSSKISQLLAPLTAAGQLEPAVVPAGEEKRCGFITGNSDPVYVAYHDEEWGVPVHDDNLLFELLVLSGAQVGMDWTTVLKKRQDLRSAFAGFDPDVVSRFTEKQMASIADHYDIDLARVRGVVDNSKRVLEARTASGSFSNYVWGFVNHKPLSPCYRSSRKVPAKTSKSESLSKDMVRRGFRFVGPTVVQCFMQAAGLTNDHVVSCPRHAMCAATAAAGA